MPWAIGIDEAGYGPNLGPLLQVAVAVKLPADEPIGWQTLEPVIHRANQPAAGGKYLVDDSKLVHQGQQGLARLERSLFSLFRLPAQWSLAELLRQLDDSAEQALQQELWYQPSWPLPTAWGEEPSELSLPNGVEIRLIGINLVHTKAFNETLRRTGSKAFVLSEGLVRLIETAVDRLNDDEPMLFVCDKQGGRNFYGPILQAAFPSGWIMARQESASESAYHVGNLKADVQFRFIPRAEGESVSVALASMWAKYLREVCMGQFNRYWQQQCPGLLPTAGYPVDAKRFFAQIGPAMERLGIEADTVWRKR